MIQLYSASNTEYERNGDITLCPSTCIAQAVLNGEWELVLEHPLDKEGRWRYIEEGAVVSVPALGLQKQRYRIYQKTKDSDGVTAYARPVFLDAKGDCILLDVRPTDRTGQQALDIMTAGTPYSGESDITDVATAYYIRKNLIEAINGDIEQSFINRWGGEIVYDNYTIHINKRAGQDRGLTVKYGRNLSGISEKVSYKNIITRIIPVAYNGYTLEGDNPWVDSPLIDRYPVIYTKVVEFKDVKLKEDVTGDETGFSTLNELRQELIAQANAMFESGVDCPEVQLQINMVILSRTEEYKGYQAMESIFLGDTVHCEHSKLGVISDERVVELEWDCIHDAPQKITLGSSVNDYFNAVSSIVKNVNNVLTPNGSIAAEKVSGILDAMQTQLRYQKNMAKKQDVRAILFEDFDIESPTYGALSIGSAGFQIANTRTTDGNDWDWKTFGTAQGFSADYFIGGTLYSQNYEEGQQGFKIDLNTGEIDAPSLSINVSDEFKLTVKNEVKAITVPYYALSSDLNTAPEDGWSKDVPVKSFGQYIWRKDQLVYGDGSKEWLEPVVISGSDGLKGDDGSDAILLQVLSSNGNMFKNSVLSTTLTVEILVGGLRITSSRDMYLYFGGNAQIEWQQKKFGETSFSPIDETDPRISDNGFIFTINAEDVKLQTVYNCILNY